jgi:hypothetical protein
MTAISVACLIYRSIAYADAVFKSLYKHTVQLREGDARFFFVANDATPEVIEHLRRRGYPFIEQNNKPLSEEDMARRGYAPPEYINRIYRGFNRALFESDDIACLISSDNMFSPGWLSALLRELTMNRVCVSKLVERRHPKYGVFRGAHEANFGTCPRDFNEVEFLGYCARQATPVNEPGYAYTPMLIYRHKALLGGLFSEGNIRTTGRKPIYGDVDFFKRLAGIGVEHVTVGDSLVYHFKEGEMSEC